MKLFLNTFLLIIFFLVAVPPLTQAQSTFNQRDDEYRLLGLKRAKEAYDFARSEFDRQKILFERDLITRLDLERAQNSLADAEVNYQQSLLAVLFEEQYVSVSSAVKFQSEDGRKRVRLTLSNDSLSPVVIVAVNCVGTPVTLSPIV